MTCDPRRDRAIEAVQARLTHRDYSDPESGAVARRLHAANIVDAVLAVYDLNGDSPTQAARTPGIFYCAMPSANPPRDRCRAQCRHCATLDLKRTS